MKPEIEITSTETVKPSSPTPSNLKTYTLSVLDQTFPGIYFSSLIIYNNSRPQSNLDITHLKHCLSETLSCFYPFAGRFDNESTLSCNDEGIPFSSTRVNFRLSDALNPSTEFGPLTKLLPSEDLISPRRRPVSKLVPLAFQINVFACGGVVIGCYALHKLMDAASFRTFFKYWAGLASGEARQDLVEPDFVAAVSSFPPSQKVDRFTRTGIRITATVLWQAYFSCKVVAKTFRFSTLALSQLKAKAASDVLPNPTRFEALAAFVWEQAFAAACEAGAASPRLLSVAANIRSQTNPPLSQGCIGNLIVTAIVAQTKKLAGLSDLAIQIHKSVSSQVRAKIQDMKGEGGADAVIAYHKKLVKDIMECNPNLYKLTSWCNLGFKDADFGFGKPERIIPFYGKLHYLHRNLISFTDYGDGDGDVGIEVRIILEKNEMKILESNQLFLAFAIPI